MRCLLWIVIATAGALVVSGCRPADTARVATAEHPAAVSPGPGPTATARLSDYDKALRYTRCLTAHGVVTPDPVEGEPLVTYNMITRADRDDDQLVARMQAKRAAHQQCKQYLPPDWPVRADPKSIAYAHAFIECMRHNGIPQPEADANGMVHEPTDDSWESTPEYDAALRECRHLYDDPANNDPANR